MEQQILCDKPKIAVFITGGTILSSLDRKSGKVTPKYNGKELLRSVTKICDNYSIEGIEVLSIPGSELTLDHGLDLLRRVKGKLKEKDIHGIVVVQGTDTLDEISYLFHLLLNPVKPVVFTGSMKSAHDLYSDMKGNLVGAIQTAGSKQSKKHGVLVYMNETIFSAADVNKAHANRMDAFQSFWGPLGMTRNGDVVYFRHLDDYETFNIHKMEVKVPIIKVYSSMDTSLLEMCIEQKVDGIVIEGFGSGNVPSYLVPVIERALKNNIVVIVTTRCFDGASLGEYNYEGGGGQLEKLNVIFAGILSSQKARIKLMVLLAAGKNREEIHMVFKRNRVQKT
jgi:L-asparaginase